ncbi:MAG: hypothetical protein EOP51_11710 [Sphingobacteriales bacterium]|nr:MAG: hypothetical protein EOP51_11710 [Sphingobacteriales bacterium]
MPQNPRAAQQAVVWQIIGEWSSAGDTTLFLKQANYFYGRNKINFAGSANSYLQHVEDKRAFEVVLNVFMSLFNTEQIKSYRAAIAGSFFQTAGDYKFRVTDSRSNTEKNKNQQKFDLLKATADKIMQAEKDEDNLKQYRPYVKKIFGS